MSPRQPHQDALLFSEEIPVIRRSLAACSQLLAWAEANGSPEFRQAVAEASGTARLSPSGLACQVSLSIDYLDSAPAAWRNQ